MRRSHDLTPRQLEVAALVGEGQSYPRIAALLGMAPRTARAHVEAIDRDHCRAARGTTPYRRVMAWILARQHQAQHVA